MSRVKAGDLAIIKCGNATLNGRIVEVLYPAPAERFMLPNGYPHAAPKLHPSWVVKLIGAQASAPLDGGGYISTWYGVAIDEALYPLPGDSEPLDERIPEEVAL
jgi:hypothetical protein